MKNFTTLSQEEESCVDKECGLSKERAILRHMRNTFKYRKGGRMLIAGHYYSLWCSLFEYTSKNKSLVRMLRGLIYLVKALYHAEIYRWANSFEGMSSHELDVYQHIAIRFSMYGKAIKACASGLNKAMDESGMRHHIYLSHRIGYDYCFWKKYGNDENFAEHIELVLSFAKHIKNTPQRIRVYKQCGLCLKHVDNPISKEVRDTALELARIDEIEEQILKIQAL